MLCDVETPEYERRAIEEYLTSQSGPAFIVEHVEKLTSEYVHGQQYDVWDAHTNEGRWWVITPFTNLYSQEQIRSMDVALSFHIGLTSRVLSRGSVNPDENPRMWVLDVVRRLETARDNLDRAKEVEDVQAVGMRLRETLLTLMERLRGLELEVPPDVALQSKTATSKAGRKCIRTFWPPALRRPSFARLSKRRANTHGSTWVG